MVKDHSGNERENLLPPLHGLLFLISSKGSFKCTTPTDSKAHTTACYTSCGAPAGMRNSSMGSPWMIVLMTHHFMSERSYYEDTSRSLIQFGIQG